MKKRSRSSSSKRRDIFWVDPKNSLLCRRFWLWIPDVKIALRRLFSADSLARFLAFSLFLFFSACVSLPRSFRAMNYRNQAVYLDRNHYYKVGPLSGDWKQIPEIQPGVVFKNKITEATIATESLCGGSFEDVPLTMLTNQLLAGMKDVKKTVQQDWMLGGREALYTEVMATLDGVPVSLDIVILKKDDCQFDFYAISLPEHHADTRDAFLNFVKGFEY